MDVQGRVYFRGGEAVPEYTEAKHSPQQWGYATMQRRADDSKIDQLGLMRRVGPNALYTKRFSTDQARRGSTRRSVYQRMREREREHGRCDRRRGRVSGQS